MGKIKVTKCDIEGLCVIEPTVFKDDISWRHIMKMTLKKLD